MLLLLTIFTRFGDLVIAYLPLFQPSYTVTAHSYDWALSWTCSIPEYTRHVPSAS
jgi:hypothetical protein